VRVGRTCHLFDKWIGWKIRINHNLEIDFAKIIMFFCYGQSAYSPLARSCIGSTRTPRTATSCRIHPHPMSSRHGPIDGQTGGPARPGPVPAWPGLHRPGLHRPGLLIVPGRAARQADLSAQAWPTYFLYRPGRPINLPG
jgi:hypothetical protein